MKKQVLNTGGKKDELVAWSIASIKGDLLVGNVPEEEKFDASMSGLAPTIYWEILITDTHSIPDPSKNDRNNRKSRAFLQHLIDPPLLLRK